jgi:glycerol-3-phosphate dehydrogenase (NAD(P)+)
MKIAIIGAGMMGSALAFPARENGNQVALVGTPLDREIIDACKKENKHLKFDRVFPEGVEFYQFEQLEQAIEGVDFIIGGVSSFGVDWFLQVLEKINSSIPVITVTKGLITEDDGSLISYPEYWEKELKKKGIVREICAIGGPCTSYELVCHDKTEVAFCGKNKQVLEMIKKALATDYYYISLTNDVVGLETAVALKNGYALAIAMTIGSRKRENPQDEELHYNSQAGAFYQAVREMKKILKMQNATEDCESIGFGDLYVTVYGGRTRKIGILLGQGLSYDQAVEALNGVTLESLVIARRLVKALTIKAQKGLISLGDYPMMMHVGDVLDNGKDAQLPWQAFTFENF